MNYMFYIISSS